MRMFAVLAVFLCAYPQVVQPWQYEGPNRSALAVCGYISRARCADDVDSVCVHIDTLDYGAGPVAMVTITTFRETGVQVSIPVNLSFESINDSTVGIIDTTYRSLTDSLFCASYKEKMNRAKD